MNKITKKRLAEIVNRNPDNNKVELEGFERAISMGVSGLLTDGGHHKQWIIEEMLKLLGVDLETLREILQKDNYDWDDGIDP